MTILPEPWRSLAAEWVPRLIAAWSAEGLETPAGSVRLLALPDAPTVADGAVVATVGSLALYSTNPQAVAFLSGRPVEIGGRRVSFPNPWPRAEGIPSGLRLSWSTPGMVHGLFARIAGVRIRAVRLYARSAAVELDGVEDRSFTW